MDSQNTNSGKKIALIVVGVVVLIFACIACIAIVPAITLGNKNESSETKNTPVTNQMTPTKQNTNIPKLTDRTVIMETNFGTLNIKMLDKVAPKTTENFIRLTDNKYYDGLRFHRIAEGSGFNILQGGDPLGNGTGGQSIFGSKFEDEVVKKGTNEFVDPSLYNYNGDFALYKKGYIAMANSGPNTNGSQFFIMLGDTRLAPAYTIFGKIDDKDFPVLDKIAKDVKAANGQSDGEPDKEVKIVSAKLK